MWDWADVGNVLSDILKNVVGAMIQGVSEAIKVIATWWIYLPAPVLEGQGGELTPAERVHEFTGWGVTVVGVIATMFALVLVARRRNADTVVDLVFAFLRVLFAAALAIPATQALMRFSDEISPWLLNNISGGTFEDGLGTLTGLDAAAASGMGVGTLVLLIVVLVISIIGAVLNMILVMFSFGALPIVVGLLPVTAAYAVTARGQAAFSKTLGWIGALALFKPVACVIYGVGIASSRFISGGVDDAGQVVIQSLYGGVVLAAAGIALPVLLRLVAPAAAAGSQGAGGGGLLVGAAMVATGALTGGASAAAGAATTGGGAATSGAATSGAAAATSGTSGTAGATGTSGAAAAGKAGTSGTSGSSGASGGTGTAGTGSTGSSGAAGVGTDGASGQAGTSGAPGASGTSGASGGQGAAGKSGSSNPAGPTPNGGGSTPAPSPGTSGAPAQRAERDWARQWRSEGSAHLRAQASQADNAAEQGDDR